MTWPTVGMWRCLLENTNLEYQWEDLTDRWDMTLTIGEHKSRATLGEKRKAITQLAGYVGELFGVQVFRHFFLGFTLLQDKMQLWTCDRMGCYGSIELSISTNSEAGRQAGRWRQIMLKYRWRLSWIPNPLKHFYMGTAKCGKRQLEYARQDHRHSSALAGNHSS